MFWYRKAGINKKASVTFQAAGADKIAKPMSVLDIAMDIVNFGYYESKMLRPEAHVKSNDVDPDDQDAFETVGTINFYIPQNRSVEQGNRQFVQEPIPPEEQITDAEIKSLIDAYNAEKGGAIILEMGPTEISNYRGTPVVRLNVVKNETANYEQIPETNMANGNARMVLQMLAQFGLPVDPNDYSGAFSVDDYWLARNLITEDAKAENSRAPGSYRGNDALNSVMKGETPTPTPEPQTPWEEMEQNQGPMIYDQGMDLERIERYFSALDDVALWIEKHKVPDRTIYYG